MEGRGVQIVVEGSRYGEKERKGQIREGWRAVCKVVGSGGSGSQRKQRFLAFLFR